jgi:hypothetical protein
VRWLGALWLAGCAAGNGTPPPGDGAAPLEVTPAEYAAAAMSLTPLGDGDPLDLVQPPQGGDVVFVGALVRGLSDPSVQLAGRLLDAGGAELFHDARTVTFAPSPSDPQVMQPDLRSYLNVANITVCPAQSAVSFDGLAVTLEVTVTELVSGRTGSGRRALTLACRQSDATAKALCACQCAANYVIGMCMM